MEHGDPHEDITGFRSIIALVVQCLRLNSEPFGLLNEFGIARWIDDFNVHKPMGIGLEFLEGFNDGCFVILMRMTEIFTKIHFDPKLFFQVDEPMLGS